MAILPCAATFMAFAYLGAAIKLMATYRRVLIAQECKDVQGPLRLAGSCHSNMILDVNTVRTDGSLNVWLRIVMPFVSLGKQLRMTKVYHRELRLPACDSTDINSSLMASNKRSPMHSISFQSKHKLRICDSYCVPTIKEKQHSLCSHSVAHNTRLEFGNPASDPWSSRVATATTWPS